MRVQAFGMAARAGSGTGGGHVPVLAAVRDVAPVAQSRAVVEPGVVVDAGGADRGSEHRRDPCRLRDVDVVPVAAARRRAVVDEPPPARVMALRV